MYIKLTCSFVDGEARVEAFYGPGDDFMPVHLGGLGCEGTEETVLACSRSEFTQCSHDEDASVKCTPGELI